MHSLYGMPEKLPEGGFELKQGTVPRFILFDECTVGTATPELYPELYPKEGNQKNGTGKV